MVPLELAWTELDANKTAKSSFPDSTDLGEESVCLLPFSYYCIVVLTKFALPTGNQSTEVKTIWTMLYLKPTFRR